MKKAITFLFCFIAFHSFAQTGSPIYGGLTYGKGNINALSLSVELVRPKLNYGVLAQYNYYPATVYPDDYAANGILSKKRHTRPNIVLATMGMTVGKYVQFDKRARLNLRGGAAVNIFNTPQNFQAVSGSGCSGWMCLNFGTEYTYDYKKEVVPALLLNPRVEIKVAKPLRLILGTGANINAKRSAIYMEGGILLGE